jgi:TRAP-type C4-dicarboxylate transport system substrate-binding protein
MGLAAGCGGQKKAEPAGPQTIELKIGGGHPANGMTYTQAAVEYFQPEIAKRVAEKTNYRIKWTEAYGGTVAKLAEALGATQSGLLDVCVNSFAFEPAKLFLMNMNYYVPFASSDPVLVTKASRKVMDENKEVYDNLWKKYNQKFLALGPTGSYELITTFPVSKVTDLKGRKIAAAGPNLTLLEGTGAIPVQSNLNEAYTAMQTGVYEGWIMWPDSSYRFKLHEVGKYYTIVGFGADAIQGISVNLDVWNKLPKEVQDIFIEVSKEYEIKSAEMAKQYDIDALEKMRQAGVKVNVLSDEEKAKWAAAIPNVPQQKAEEAEKLGYPGKKIWASYIKNLEDLGHKFPRKWEIK